MINTRNLLLSTLLPLVVVLVGSVSWSSEVPDSSDGRTDLLRPMKFRLFEPIEEDEPLLVVQADRHGTSAYGQEEQGYGRGGTWRLSLQDLVFKTVENNLDLRIQRYQPTLAELLVDSYRSIFDPSFSTSITYSSRTNPQATALGGGDVTTDKTARWNYSISKKGIFGWTGSIGWDNSRSDTDSAFATVNPSFSSSMSFSFQQPLLKDFGRFVNKKQIMVAKNNFAISEEDFRRQVIDKVLEAVSAYWNLLYRIDELKVAKESLKLAQDHYEINKTRVEVGTMAPLDIAQAEAGVAEREEAVIVAESAIREAEDLIRKLLNVPIDSRLWDVPIEPTDYPELEDVDVDLEKAIQDALENRSELKTAIMELSNKEIEERYSRNQKLPDLNFTASYGLSGLGGTVVERDAFGGEIIGEIPGGYGDALDQIIDRDYPNWSLGLDFAYPIFNRAAETGLRSAIIERSIQEDTIENLKLLVVQEVRGAVRQVDTARQRVHAARVSVGLQEKKLDAEQKKFEHGLSTSFQVLQFQNDLTVARSSEIQALTDYRAALINLEKAVGNLLEKQGIKIADEAPGREGRLAPVVVKRKAPPKAEKKTEKPEERKGKQLKHIDPELRKEIHEE